MAHAKADAIRNVALVGHRGSGKTSLNEALLFQAGATNRLGTVADGTTVSDSAADEKAREHVDRREPRLLRLATTCKVNLIDTPGEPSFVADALCALRVCESAVFVVNGVMGVEVATAAALGPRRRARARAPRLREHARPRAGRLLPRARLPQGGVRAARGGHRDPDRRRARAARRGRPDRHEGVRVRGRRAATTAPRSTIPDDLRARAEEYREKLMDEVAEVSDELMERYLEGEEISHEETVAALESGVSEGRIFPVTCGVATRNLGINRLLDAFCRGPSLAGRARRRDRRGGRARAGGGPRRGGARVQDARRPVRRAHQPVPRLPGRRRATTRTRSTPARHVKERIGQLLVPQGKEMGHADEFGPGDIGAVAKLKETHAGDVLARPRRRHPACAARAARAGHGVRDRATREGRRGQGVHGASPAPGGGSDGRPAPRPADRRADRRRACRRSTSR